VAAAGPEAEPRRAHRRAASRSTKLNRDR